MAEAVPTITDDAIREVMAEIAHLQRAGTLQLALSIGEVVVSRFYGGDPSRLRDRARKDASVRKLANHPDLPISATSLCQSIALYEMANRLAAVRTCEHLCTSHFRVVLGLPEKTQKRLITQGEKNKWTVEKMQAEARKNRKSGGGRPPYPAFVKTIHHLQRFAEEDERFDGLDKLDDLAEEEVLQLYQTVTGLKLRCDNLQKQLERRVPGFSDMPESK